MMMDFYVDDDGFDIDDDDGLDVDGDEDVSGTSPPYISDLLELYQPS